MSAKSISKYITGGRVEGQKLTAEFVERSFYFLLVMPSTETTWFVRGGGRGGVGWGEGYENSQLHLPAVHKVPELKVPVT